MIAEKSGIASFVDLIDGVLVGTTDDATGISSKSVIDWNLIQKHRFKTKNYTKR